MQSAAVDLASLCLLLLWAISIYLTVVSIRACGGVFDFDPFGNRRLPPDSAWPLFMGMAMLMVVDVMLPPVLFHLHGLRPVL